MAEGQDDDSLTPVTKYAGVIPHFWYDIIGQMVPGSFLLVGMWSLGISNTKAECFVKTYLTNNSDLRFIPLLITLAVVAYFIGGILGPFSHLLIQEPFWKWFPTAIPATTVEHLRPIFGPMKNENDIKMVRDQCSWVVWKRAPDLAMIFSRWDAMALSARSIALSSAGLLVYSIAKCYGAASVTLLIVSIGSLLSFNHFRGKALTSRFEMLALVLHKHQPKT
jgi:hypothetical protein